MGPREIEALPGYMVWLSLSPTPGLKVDHNAALAPLPGLTTGTAVASPPSPAWALHGLREHKWLKRHNAYCSLIFGFVGSAPARRPPPPPSLYCLQANHGAGRLICAAVREIGTHFHSILPF